MANYKNPNGYGSVVKLKGNRRKPYAVRKTVGWDDRAYPIYAIVGYYPTRKDAMMALAAYNHEPYDIDLAKITFKELFERWSETELPKLSKSLASSHKASYNYCKSLYDIPYRNIRKFQMQQCIDNCGKGYSTQTIIKNLLVTLDKYAYDQDIISKRYSETLKVAPKETQSEHIPYSDKEVQTLWEHRGEPFIDETLFQLYTGFRISEMLQMRCDNIDLEQGIMRGGMKTAAGKDRVVPIHSKLLPLVLEHFGKGEYLFNHERSKTANDPETALRTRYIINCAEYLKTLGMIHRTHDCRHAFRSKLDSAGANKVCIDLMMGHKTGDVGERVYTHKTIEELKAAIELLNYGV